MATAPQQRDLTQGPVAKTLLAFALPSLGVNILQSLNGSINAIWVGRLLGEKALAATSNATMTMFVMFAALFGFSMATTIIIGQAMGRRDIIEVRRTIGTALGMFVMAGLGTAIVGWIFAPQMLQWLATPQESFPLALSYLRVIFLGMPFTFMAILLTSALRGVGDSITPFGQTILNVTLDIILNPLLIAGFGPIPALGIAGSALATLIAGMASTAFLIRRIYAHDLIIRLRGDEWRWLRPDPAHMRPILRMGMPMGMSMIIMSASALVMIGLVNRAGVDTTAAFGVLNQLWSYVQMPAVAVGSAVSAMAAQNIGAGLWDRVSRIAIAGGAINTAMTAILVLIITIFERPLLGLFLPAGSAAIPIAIHVNHLIGWTFIIMGISMVVTSVVRANGAVVAPLIILIFSSVIVRFTVGFGLHPHYGVEAVWWSMIAGGVSSGVLAILYYLSGSWKKAKMMSVPGNSGFAQGTVGD